MDKNKLFDKVIDYVEKTGKPLLALRYSEKVVLFAPALFFDPKDLIEIIKVVESFLNLTLIVKLHPTSNFKDFKRFASKKVILVKKNIHELINASDLVIIKYSTVGLEAMAFGKPLIVFGLNLTKENIYAETKAVLVAHNGSELKKAIKDCFDNEAVKKELAINREKVLKDYLNIG